MVKQGLRPIEIGGLSVIFLSDQPTFGGDHMEDYEAQEVEFWAKLEEEGISRSSMLRRSAAAAFGLTVMGSASTAFGMSRASLASPPTKGSKAALAALVKGAKKEGHLNTIALPPDWANYGELIS